VVEESGSDLTANSLMQARAGKLCSGCWRLTRRPGSRRAQGLAGGVESGGEAEVVGLGRGWAAIGGSGEGVGRRSTGGGRGEKGV
jgi:hypothetical protein